MTLTAEAKKSSISGIDLLAENMALRAQLNDFQRKFQQKENEQKTDDACDASFRQADREIPVIGNYNHGIGELEEAIDSFRRYDIHLRIKEGIYVPPGREAVTVVFLNMDHYLHQREILGEPAAKRNLRELVTRINFYLDLRRDKRKKRPADVFSKAGWQDHKFMFVLPATDKKGALKFLERVQEEAISDYEGVVDISYGIANHAADVERSYEEADSRKIALELVEIAMTRARKQDSEFSGKIEKQAQYHVNVA